MAIYHFVAEILQLFNVVLVFISSQIKRQILDIFPYICSKKVLSFASFRILANEGEELVQLQFGFSSISFANICWIRH